MKDYVSTNLMKLFLLMTVLLSACQGTTSPTPALPEAPATAASQDQAPIQTSMPGGRLISSNGVEFTIPTGLGTDASVKIVSEAVNQPGEYPAYLAFTLQGYSPSKDYYEPQIRVISVQELAKYSQGQNTLMRLRALLANPAADPSSDAGVMPSSDSFSQVVTAASLKPMSPSGISGVRMLAGFGAIAVMPLFSGEIMYQFQGLTADGQFYVTARFPLSVPFLAVDGSSPVPPDGVSIDISAVTAEGYGAYLKQISDRLNTAEAANTLSPSIALMDELVQSIKVDSASLSAAMPTPSAAQIVEPPAQTLQEQAGEVSIDFVNQSAAMLDIFWVQQDGSEKLFGSAPAGGKFTQATYATHIWRVRDVKGNLVMEYTANSDPQQTVTILPDMVSADSVTASQPPARPSVLTYGYDCSSGDLKITLTWTDNANNEQGYRVYRDGVLIQTLASDAAGYVEFVARGTYSYAVTAFNSAGETSPIKVLAESPLCQ